MNELNGQCTSSFFLGHREMDKEPGPKHIHSSLSSPLDHNPHTYSIMERKQHVWYRERRTKNTGGKTKTCLKSWQWTLVTGDTVKTKTFPTRPSQHDESCNWFLSAKVALPLAHRRMEEELHRQKRLLACPQSTVNCDWVCNVRRR